MAIEGDLPTAYDIPGIARVYGRRPLLVLRRSLQMGTSFGRIPSIPSSFVSTPSLPSPPLGFAALPCPCIGFVLLDLFSFRKKERTKNKELPSVVLVPSISQHQETSQGTDSDDKTIRSLLR
ncbi:hypothetical protein ZWY2020_003577 [Hordeum vulgare]|nr:hypothetical protein ZWY2020_003577 [Hordeum vulgare]